MYKFFKWWYKYQLPKQDKVWWKYSSSRPSSLKGRDNSIWFYWICKNAHEFDSDITADRHPRTIFGFNEKYYFFLAIDGRTRKSAGLYLEECCELVSNLGFSDAINLDGGSSSTLIVDNRLINHPRIKLLNKLSIPFLGSERKIPTALIIVSDNFM